MKWPGSALTDSRSRHHGKNERGKEAARFELVSAARTFHFRVNSGHGEIPSSVAILSPKGEVRVTFKDAYKKLDEAKFETVKQVIGEQLAKTCRHRKVIVKHDPLWHR